jgi:hypothetical protein
MGDDLLHGEFDASGEQVWWFFEGPDCAKDFIKWCLAKRDHDKEGFTVSSTGSPSVVC